MAGLSNELVGDAYTSDFAWTTLEDLSDIGNRMAGQQGETKGAEYLAQRFRDHGLRDVSIREFPVPGWWRGSATLSYQPDQTVTADHHVLALPGSPSGEASGEIVDVGTGLPEEFDSVDVDGRLALVSSETPDDYGRWVHRTEKYGRAADNGATGFLFSNEISGALPLTGYVGEDGAGPIPAVGLSREMGHRLQQQLADRDRLTGTLDVTARNDTSTSRNVEAVLGPETDEELLLTAHVDAHDIAQGATDNGVGCGLVAEVARLLQTHESDLETSVRFVVFGAEEIGYLGAHHWVETHDLSSVKTIINVDGNGSWEDVTVYTHGWDRLQDRFADLPASLQAPASIDTGYLPFSDHWPFVQNGVPGVMVRSEATTGRGWGHTHGDTLDKLSPESFPPIACFLAAAILELSDQRISVPHVDRASIIDDLEDAGHAAGLRAAGAWPFEDPPTDSSR